METGSKYNEIMDWHSHISIDPAICHGQACIRGTRIPVSVVLDNLADGESFASIREAYPSLIDDDIRAAIAYAAELAHERVLPTTPGAA